MGKLLAACLALAGISLLLPSQPSYDPWAWLVWGRELWHGQAIDPGGPSWKPLPVAFTFLFAPAGGLAPYLWLVVERTCGLLALGLAFRVAARLAGPTRAARIVAGTVAAVALALAPLWLRYLAHGNEAPIAVMLMLLALERHLDGAPGMAFAAGVVACLLRPELYPFVSLYAVWYAWRAAPWARVGVVAAMLVVPALWIVPEWLFVGSPLEGGRQATSEPFWSLSLSERPWLSALERAHQETGLALELAALFAVVFARRASRRTVLVLAAAAFAWLGMYVGMTQYGFSGNARYFLPGLVVICLLAGAGAARFVELGSRRRPVLTGAVCVALLALGASSLVHRRVDQARAEARLIDQRTRLHEQLTTAVRLAGGPAGVKPFGPPTVNRAFETHLAWDLRMPIKGVEVAKARAVVFRSDAPVSEPKPLPPWIAARGLQARVGYWRVFRAPHRRDALAGRAG